MIGELQLLRPHWLLALLPLALVLWRKWQNQSESQSWRTACDHRLLPYLLIGGSGRSNRHPLLLAAVTGVLSIIALSGPVWKKLPQPVMREHSALVVALDLSRSMDAADLRPSRLERARLKLLDLLQMRREGQTALLVYAAQPFVVTPLTDDAGTIAAQVSALSTSMMPSQGSRTDRVLVKAEQLLKNAGIRRGDILLITDGIAKKQGAQAFQQLTSAGHRISILGVGTKEGAPIPKPDGGFFKDSAGDIVVVKLKEMELQQLAHQGDGRYHRMSIDDSDLDYLLDGLVSERPQDSKEAAGLTTDIWHEEGPWLLLLVLPMAAFMFRRGLLLLLLAVTIPMPRPASALEWNDLWSNPDQQATELLEQGEFGAAAKHFEDPQWKANAHYLAEEYQESVKALEDIDTPDSWYNRGNALARSGQLAEAVQAYQTALERQPDHADSAFNKKLVEELLQQQQQQQQQQNSDQNKDGKQSQDRSGNQEQNQEGGKQQSGQSEPNQPPKDGESSGNQGESGESESTANQKQGRNQAEPEIDDQKQAAAADATKQETDNSEQEANANVAQESETTESEADRAVEQWLRRIPDDPGGLLRRKFRYQYQRQQQPPPESEQW